MRGDSRRDLYSKTLALCGLGVLAAAGALVDYWPVGVRFPAPSEAPIEPPTVVGVPSADGALALLASALDQRRPTQPKPALLARPDEPAAAYVPLPTEDARFDVGTPLEVAWLPAPAFVNVRAQVPLLPGDPVHLVAPSMGRISAPAVSVDDGGFFLTAAFRKTGSSIVRTGAKTGSSLAGAARVVGGAVRRVLPN